MKSTDPKDEKFKKFLDNLQNQGGVPISPDGNPMVPNIDTSKFEFRIFPDIKNNAVILEFNMPVTFVGFDPKQARKIAKELMDMAKYVERAPKEKANGKETEEEEKEKPEDE